MIYKATNLIAEAFDLHGLKYRITELGEVSMVEAGFEITAGPEVIVRFISKNEENDVAVRVYGLVHKVPEEKRIAVMEVCNRLCAGIRFYKFYLDPDNGNVNVEADLPVKTDDDCLGECCFELFVRSMQILDTEYHRFTEALCGVNGSGSRKMDLLRALKDLSERPIIVKDDDTD